MKKYKLIRQRTWFNDEIITEQNRTYETIIEANSCEEIYKTTTITNEEIGKKIGYKLGDVIKTLIGIKFIKDIEEEIIDLMLGDPYYKVYENDNLKYQHKCNYNHNEHN